MTETTTAPTMYEIDVPMWRSKPPLTANQRLHWRERHRRTKSVREAIRHHAGNIGPCKRITVQLHYRPGDNRRRDAPNLHPTAKPAVDGLVDAGLVADDTPEYVTEVMPAIHPGPGPRRLWITVEVTR